MINNTTKSIIMNKPTDYKAIAFWGNVLGSFDYYIKRMQREACADNAPLNAIYKLQDGGWATTDRVSNENTRRDMKAAGLI